VFFSFFSVRFVCYGERMSFSWRRTLMWLSVVGTMWFLGASTVRAQDVVLRALLPNPQGSDTNEWLALENTTTASISAQLYQLRDVSGAVTVYNPKGSWPAGVSRWPQSTTKINLNNEVDQIQLRLASNSAVIQISDQYTQASDDQVWLWCDDHVWRWVSLAEYTTREATRNWNCAEVEDVASTSTELATPTPNPTPLATTSQSIVSTPLPTQRSTTTSPTPSTDPTTINWQRLLRMPGLSATAAAKIPSAPPIIIPKSPPFDGHTQAEWHRWQQRAIAGSLAIFFGGACWFILALPTLIQLLYSLHIWNNSDFG
jgi:hypothetical protein